MSGKQNTLSLLLFWFLGLKNMPDKDTSTEMPEEQTEPEASQSLVTEETMAIRTSSSAASSAVTSSAGVRQSATQRD